VPGALCFPLPVLLLLPEVAVGFRRDLREDSMAVAGSGRIGAGSSAADVMLAAAGLQMAQPVPRSLAAATNSLVLHGSSENVSWWHRYRLCTPYLRPSNQVDE
jgi:hypothetical protein